MRLGRRRSEQPSLDDDPADETVTSELGWVRIDVDMRRWIVVPTVFPEGYDRDSWAAATAPLPVFLAIWRQSGERVRRLRLLTEADAKSTVGKPQVAEVTTEHLGTGLRVLNQRAQVKGPPLAFLSYAFRVEEHETDLQLFTAASDPALTAARDDIERLVQGITVYRNTEERPVAGP